MSDTMTAQTAHPIPGSQCEAFESRPMDVAEVPLPGLFEPWERVDWLAVKSAIDSGKVVHIPGADYGREFDWKRCAETYLGRLNADVLFGNEGDTYGLWIAPRGALRPLWFPCERIEEV